MGTGASSSNQIPNHNYEQAPSVLSLAYLSTHPLSYVLTHPPFVLFATVIALLVYVVAQGRRHREEVRLLSLRVGQLGRDGEFVVQALQVNEERVERLGEGVDKVEDAVVEVSRAVREAIVGKMAATTTATAAMAAGSSVADRSERSARLRGRDSADVEMIVGTAPTVAGGTVAESVYRDHGYDTVDDEAGARHRGDTRSRYAESVYTVRGDDEYDDDWERRTMVTEVAPSSRRSGAGMEEKRRREEKIWSKGDWKGLEVFG
ncbi:hypothetical protein PFICI_03651 [Pestalotiopsis fici W106-1]|uniref:Uncharacterized protein n=1 Tax=Pestalotiopsis fici (strain W106-1 / CGMCC3.15140) TaxID=1229662 RepID=W3XK61_PESFW|nr:uncharacterized protein PFICI_03651 [Pestalotiopsis fici W106-1]ETS85626.1 hypothetical protein PFICI_03651 [Pestalotiopsis fici W106-1]